MPTPPAGAPAEPPAAEPLVDPTDELASFLEHLAEAEFDGYCEPYARIARELAADDDLLGRVATMAPAPKVVPVLLLAAVHDLVLAHPDREPERELAGIYAGDEGDPWPPFRALLLERFDALAATMAQRTIQTNEVGRAAAVLPALVAVQRRSGRDLALVELGPSAGLNLFVDRYHLRFPGPHGTVDLPPRASTDEVDGGVDPAIDDVPVLTCEARGPLALPLDPRPTIRRREGIDPRPVDVTDDEACRWLEACLWPRNPGRARRLRQAIAVARRTPPSIHRGTALDRLEDVIAAIPGDLLPVVTSTWVLAYASKPDRQATGELLDRLGAGRDLACITGEYPGIAPWITRPDRPPTATDGKPATVLGLATWQEGVRHDVALAWMQAHGQWLDWLDPATAG